jgi:arabinose-5-phosphate isomerase
MTGNPKSALAKHSDIVLLMPKEPEACPNGLAPTTSTTVTLALGDALSIALLERMNLTPEQFGVFHPGGKLGKRLMHVSEIMRNKEELPVLPSSSNMGEAIIMLAEKNLGCVLISDDGETLKGIITDGDLKRHMSADLVEKSVKDIMTVSPITISKDDLAVSAVKIMSQTPGQYLTSLVVLNKDKSISGLIRLQDCLQIGVA